MRTINEKELKEVGLNPVDYIVEQWKGILQDDQDKALVCVVSEKTEGNGYLLGLATRNANGYQSLNTILEEHNYNIASGWVNKANEKIFNRDAKETMMIVISSMRGE